MIRTLLFLALVSLSFVLCTCSAPAPALREAVVPAQAEAERLRAVDPPAATEVRDLRAQELAAQTAAAQASAAGKAAEAAYQRQLGEELGRLRATAEEREREQRQQLATLAAEADRRAVAERAELDRREADAQRVADVRAADERRQADRRWAGWGLALAVAAGIALRLIGLPGLWSVGVPIAVGVGCLTLAAWSSVPWLATVLGIVLAIVLVIVLAVVARHLVAEWVDYAERLGEAHPAGKAMADVASLARQPAWVRWIIDHLVARHRAGTASPITPTTAQAGV